MPRSTRVTFAGAYGSPSDWTLSSLNSKRAAESLALFSELGLSGEARVAQMPSSSFDNALIFASHVCEGTRWIAALS
jgi:hypothetical protein